MSSGASLLLGLTIGVLSSWALRHRWPGQERQRSKASQTPPVISGYSLSTAQLLAWIDAATQGWLILTPDRWAEQSVKDGDSLEIVTIVGGGS